VVFSWWCGADGGFSNRFSAVLGGCCSAGLEVARCCLCGCATLLSVVLCQNKQGSPWSFAYGAVLHKLS